jgi:hypothetical protein
MPHKGYSIFLYQSRGYMKQKANLMDLDFNAFDPAIRSEVKANAQAAQNLLDFGTAISDTISSLKNTVVSVFTSKSKTQGVKPV